MGVLARTDNFTATTELVVEECCSCHCLFAMPADFQRRARKDPSIWFYCPLGHHQHYTGPTEEQKLRKKLEAEQQRAARLSSQLDQAQADAEHQRARVRGYQGALVKTKKRAAAGVCPVPGCKRSFADVARHVERQHPDFHPEHDPTEDA